MVPQTFGKQGAYHGQTNQRPAIITLGAPIFFNDISPESDSDEAEQGEQTSALTVAFRPQRSKKMQIKDKAEISDNQLKNNNNHLQSARKPPGFHPPANRIDNNILFIFAFAHNSL